MYRRNTAATGVVDPPEDRSGNNMDLPLFKDQVNSVTAHRYDAQAASKPVPSSRSPAPSDTQPNAPTIVVEADAVLEPVLPSDDDDNDDDVNNSKTTDPNNFHCGCFLPRTRVILILAVVATALVTAAIVVGSICGSSRAACSSGGSTSAAVSPNDLPAAPTPAPMGPILSPTPAPTVSPTPAPTLKMVNFTGGVCCGTTEIINGIAHCLGEPCDIVATFCCRSLVSGVEMPCDPNLDAGCCDGFRQGNACCPTDCGGCGGTNCSQLPLGAGQCCTTNFNQMCEVGVPPPCLF